MSEREFSVFQFFPDDSYECIKQFVDAKEAVETARDFSQRPAAKIGIIRELRITDGGDFIVFQWKFGEGVVFPPEAAGRQ
jgi:hypothetical protein